MRAAKSHFDKGNNAQTVEPAPRKIDDDLPMGAIRLLAETATRLRIAAPQIAGVNNSFLAAVAAAEPARLTTLSVLLTRKDDQTAESAIEHCDFMAYICSPCK